MKKSIEWLLFESGISNYQISKATGISAVVLGKYTNHMSDVGRMTLDNAIKLNDYFKEMIKMAKNKFGTVEFEGKTYTLLNQAELTGRQLLEWQTEEGYTHFDAPAVDEEGNQFRVEWLLQIPEGCEDLGDLDWDDVDDVTAYG